MKQREQPYEEIYDLLAIRVLVEHACRTATTRSASSTTGGRRCRSASRTTSRSRSRTGTSRCTRRCSGPGGQLLRDPDPHARDAPHRGVSASRRTGCYKERREARRRARSSTCTWFRQVLELQLDAKTPDEFLEFLKLDLYQDEIFVFTPTGDVIQLPEGRDADRLRVRGAHGGRAALRRARRSTAASRRSSRELKQLGDGRDPHVAQREAEPRLAGARAHGPRAAQDPAVAAARGARSRRQQARAARSSSARCGAAARRSSTTTSSIERGARHAQPERRAAPDRVDRAGRRAGRAGAQGALPGPGDVDRAAAEADARSSGSSIACAARRRACASRASTA